jgi:xanthine dehydrogenase YagS FAD-binding subunit
MKEFKIAQPRSLGQVTSLLSQEKIRYSLMAGGTDLLDELKSEIIAPDIVIDLKSVPDFSFIKTDKKSVAIGAMTTVADLAENPIIQENFPGLKEAALSLASPQLRNVGTVGGNLCQRPRCWYYRDPDTICRKKGGSRCYAIGGRNRYHAIFGGGICHIVHPSDLAPALISLDAEVTINGTAGEKNIVKIEDFFTPPQKDVRKENILGSHLVVSEIRIPLPKNGAKSTYHKFKERGTWDFAVVSAAVNGVVSNRMFADLRIVCGGVAPIPWRLKKAEDFIKGKKVTESVIRQGAIESLADAKPLEENAYKLDLLEAVLYAAISSLV